MPTLVCRAAAAAKCREFGGAKKKKKANQHERCRVFKVGPPRVSAPFLPSRRVENTRRRAQRSHHSPGGHFSLARPTVVVHKPMTVKRYTLSVRVYLLYCSPQTPESYYYYLIIVVVITTTTVRICREHEISSRRHHHGGEGTFARYQRRCTSRQRFFFTGRPLRKNRTEGAGGGKTSSRHLLYPDLRLCGT